MDSQPKANDLKMQPAGVSSVNGVSFGTPSNQQPLSTATCSAPKLKAERAEEDDEIVGKKPKIAQDPMSYNFSLSASPSLQLSPEENKSTPSLRIPLNSTGLSSGLKRDIFQQNQAEMAQPDNVLSEQYENQIRPCIDLIDSLRSLGVEKDLGLPAIAVIGDQSSGKSSVLEALSGVSLPRGSGIVTRCPLELKLKKSSKNSKWCGKISYGDKEKKLETPSEVEKEVRAAQDSIAGTGCGVSEDLISLEIVSPNVPDLTLIDLPGITRVPLPNQPPNIGHQIKQMITKYIKRQETINLVVVPSNVDIATTEALEMARAVDPSGERTLGILTKPDLVDKGAEADTVNIVQNQLCPLKKGYMIVKCRGQSEIQKNISLEEAIRNEKAFFENHDHFSILLNDGHATVPLLAERLTEELVEHIIRNLPALEDQICKKLNAAEEKLNMIGLMMPETDTEKMAFLIEKIRLFSEEIGRASQGEEEVTKGDKKLFTKIRNQFYSWETTLQGSSSKFSQEMRDDVQAYENCHRGRELTGFINFRTFENIAKKKIDTFQDPAFTNLHRIIEIVRTSFNEIALKHFVAFQNLYRNAKGKLENICNAQQKEAEHAIQTQFKMERIIYCQDTLYGENLTKYRAENANGPNGPKGPSVPPTQIQLTVQEMSYHIRTYFKTATARLGTQIPLIIQHYVLFEFAQQLQVEMIMLIQNKENLDVLLQEKQDTSRERKNLRDRIRRLQAAQQRLARFPN